MALPPDHHLAALLAEKKRRMEGRAGALEKAEQLIADAHPKQLACITNKSPLLAALCTRRSGKSRGWLRKLAYDAATVPGCRQIYINTTRTECERIAWRGIKRADGLLGLNDIFGLGGTPNMTKLRIDFPEDSQLELIPADDEKAINKFLGGAYHRVLIDEAQKMPHIQRLIQEVLAPAMMDYGGQIVLIGTPSRDLSGFFYEVTKDDADAELLEQWSVHRWSVLDNPFFGDTEEERYKRTIAKYMQQTGLAEDSPEVQREWYGRWVKEDANYVYAVHQMHERDVTYDGHLPTREDGSAYEWHYGCGVDIGYHPDPFAYVIWAWHHESDWLWEIESFKQTKLIPDQQAAILQRLMAAYEFDFMVADAGGGGKLVVQGWIQGWHDRFPIPISEAKKTEKPTAIEMYNNDIRLARIKFIRGSHLHEEAKALTWLPRRPNSYLREDKRNPNHCLDASLYAHREAQHHRFQPKEPEPEEGTTAYWRREEARMFREKLEDIQAMQEFENAWMH